MALQSYIVLQRKRALVAAAANQGQPRALGREAVAETIDIVRTELTSAERADLRRDPRTRAIARPMPMKLIEPVAGPSAATGPAWGIPAVGATSSPFDGRGITVAVLHHGI